MAYCIRGGVVSFEVGRLALSTALSGYLHHAQEGLYTLAAGREWDSIA
jgi:hypothetical protein